MQYFINMGYAESETIGWIAVWIDNKGNPQKDIDAFIQAIRDYIAQTRQYKACCKEALKQPHFEFCPKCGYKLLESNPTGYEIQIFCYGLLTQPIDTISRPPGYLEGKDIRLGIHSTLNEPSRIIMNLSSYLDNGGMYYCEGTNMDYITCES